MNYFPYHKIVIGSIKLNTFNSLMITSDINELTDILSITIPYSNISLTSTSLTFQKENGDAFVISKGDEITVYLDFSNGQNERDSIEDSLENKKIFLGYIKGFNVMNELIEIQCEDSMYLLKQNKVNFSFPKGTKAVEVIEEILKDSNLDSTFPIADQDIVTVVLGKIRTGGFVTGAKVLQSLKDKYKYFSYFKLNDEFEPILTFGLKYTLELSDTFAIQFAYPIQSGLYPIIQNNLSYELFNKIDDLIVVATFVDELTNLKTQVLTIDGEEVLSQTTQSNKKAALPDDSSEAKNKRRMESLIKQREFRVDLNLPKTDLEGVKNLVKDTWNSHPTSGFKGTFTTFGKPIIKIGSIIELQIDDGFEELIIENYYVDKVVVKVMPNTGLTQEITIGAKIKSKETTTTTETSASPVV